MFEYAFISVKKVLENEKDNDKDEKENDNTEKENENPDTGNENTDKDNGKAQSELDSYAEKKEDHTAENKYQRLEFKLNLSGFL